MLPRLVVPALALFFAVASAAQTASPTPPMGWNSWDAYGLSITEAQFRQNASVLHDKLLPFGWRYAVIDEGWFLRNPQDRPTPAKLIYQLDANGRYVPVPVRFPSAESNPPAFTPEGQSIVDPGNRGFTELGRWVHSQGLLFGIHIVRGIPRESVRRNLPIASSAFHAQDAADTADACGWDPTNWGIKDNAAGQAWYDSLIHQYASWGVDFLKVDCIADHPYKVSEIRQIRRAIDKVQRETGHSMVLSLSPGPTNPSHAAEVAELSNMWRISNDFWDLWSGGNFADGFPQSAKGQFDHLAAWSQPGIRSELKPGNWPDADMLPFGELKPSPGWGDPRHTRLTLDEERTVISLWSIAQSPLILGANLTLLDEPTLSLLTNREVLRLDQHASMRGKPVAGFTTGDLRVWRAEVAPSGAAAHRQIAVGLFNLSDAPLAVDRSPAELGFDVQNGRSVDLTNLWTKQPMHVQRVKLTIPPHGCVLLQQP